MEVIDPGHVYKLWQLGSEDSVTLTFVKRSGGAIQYDEEWPGLQTQEVIRSLIERTEYLNSILPCAETDATLWHLRSALYEYEVRAYRRKKEKVNREKPSHNDEIEPKAWREHVYSDIPFTEHLIEQFPIIILDKDRELK